MPLLRELVDNLRADAFSFDVLDATKLVPEELVPLRTVGKLVLNRNPDNFFAETEQVAFCTQHVVPGIDFSNDPLLQGRNFSYLDTQISRLGGANFHEIPINSPVAQVHNNQRDGLHRQAIARGRVNYEPNSLGGGCPFQAGAAGFVSFPEPMERGAHKVRGKAERFADHYTQATLFWKSQSDVEKTHIIKHHQGHPLLRTGADLIGSFSFDMFAGRNDANDFTGRDPVDMVARPNLILIRYCLGQCHLILRRNLRHIYPYYNKDRILASMRSPKDPRLHKKD